MKNILFTIVILFTSMTFYSQDIGFLKKMDTIYFEFKGNKHEKKYGIQTTLLPNNFDEKAFELNLKNNKKVLIFEHVKYKNWQNKDVNITSSVRKINEYFLKKNKEKIIATNLLDKYDYKEIVCEILTRNKVFYIVDYTEKSQKGIMVYEVISLSLCDVLE
jgi:hypothetical protein